MYPRHYEDFDLQLVKSEAGFNVRVLGSPSGEVKALRIASPLSGDDLEWLRKAQPVRDVRDREAAEEVRRIGGQVFQAVFDGEVGSLFRRSLDAARQDGKGMRLRLRLSEAGELSEFPWEFLYDRSRRQFLALQRGISVVRFLDFPEPVRPRAEPPIRMLVLTCLPQDCRRLDAEREWGYLSAALKNFHQEGLFQVERLTAPTLEGLEEQLGSNSYHILHFIGHGHYDRDRHSGELLLLDAQGQSRPLSPEKLSVLLSEQQELRLALLNCCEGARASLVNPFAGLAQNLLARGVTAAVAMQFPVTDQGALDFARLFYGTLGGGLPVDAAVARARRGLCLGLKEGPPRQGDSWHAAPSGEVVEWGAPVVYMRSDEGCLFDLPERRTRPWASGRFFGRPFEPGRRRAGGRRSAARLVGLSLLMAVLALLIWTYLPQDEPEPIPLLPGKSEAGVLQPAASWGSGSKRVRIVVIEKFEDEADLDRQLREMANWRIGRVLVYRAFCKASSACPVATYQQGERTSYRFDAEYSTHGTTIEKVRRPSRTGGLCRDGGKTDATGSGACSGRGGVQRWLHDPETVVALLCGDDKVVANTGADSCSEVAWHIRNRNITPVDLEK